MWKKVTRLRDELDQCAVPDDGDTNSDSSTPLFIETFETFATLTEDDVCMLIGNSKSTSCCLDPIPTPLLKSCIEPLIPVITKIINTSFDSEIFPVSWKEAVVIPLLKKSGLDLVFKNLRPVSILAYVFCLMGLNQTALICAPVFHREAV